MPGQSIRCFFRCGSVSVIQPTIITIPTMPSGRFTKNTHRHDRWSVMNPPRSGPTMVATPNTIEARPMTLGRSSRVYMSPIVVCATGMRAPAPTPCSARQSTSMSIEVERPQSTDATRNRIMPMRKIRLRPYMSDRRPQTGMVAISASR